MTKVSRLVIADGAFHEVSCAVRDDGVTSPVAELLDLLEQGVWPEPGVEDFPDELQARDRSRLLAEAEHLSEYGVPARDYDYLDQGIWEFKIGRLRVTFYDTPGDGSFNPKRGVRSKSPWGRRHEFPEEFDEFVRLGHYFGKDSQKTPPSDLREALTVRKEDLSHDGN